MERRVTKEIVELTGARGGADRLAVFVDRRSTTVTPVAKWPIARLNSRRAPISVYDSLTTVAALYPTMSIFK